MLFCQVPADPDRIGDTVIYEMLAGNVCFGYVVSIMDAPTGPVDGVQLYDEREHWLVPSTISAASLDQILGQAQAITLRIGAGGTWNLMAPAVAELIGSSPFQFPGLMSLKETDWVQGSAARPAPTYIFAGEDVDATPVRLAISVAGEPLQRAIAKVVWESDTKIDHYFKEALIGSQITLAKLTQPAPLQYFHETP